uniref:Uncharacterized protein n=1 Tax=Anopheles farauti TaxID=69004 RepID=A0A182QIN5_9DIPT
MKQLTDPIEAPVGRAVPEQVRPFRVVPVLIATRTMARVEHHVVAGVVETRLIPSDLTRFAQHPGTISSEPPHIHVLNESSRFSPPQMSKPESYVPSRSKKARSIANRPPAIVGDQTGSAGLWKNMELPQYSRMSEKSSTRITSFTRWSGERSSTECTVRSSTDHASLWKQMMTDVGGRSSR